MTDPDIKELEDDLHELSHFLTYRISRLHAKLNAQASRILSASVGITLAQWRLIAFVGSGGQVTASDLVKITAMDKGLVSRNVKSLIELGLVKSLVHDKDGRIQLLSLTPKGSRVFTTALPIMQTRQKKLQENLSDEDVATFRRVMNILEAAAEEPIHR